LKAGKISDKETNVLESVAQELAKKLK